MKYIKIPPPPPPPRTWCSLTYKQISKTNQDFETKNVYTNNRYTIIWPQLSIFSICLQRRVVAWGGAGRDFPLTVFYPKKSNHTQSNKKLKLQCNLPEHWNIMMSLQLGETFSGFKLQRPVQWVLQTKNPLLCLFFFFGLNCWALAYNSFF